MKPGTVNGGRDDDKFDGPLREVITQVQPQEFSTMIAPESLLDLGSDAERKYLTGARRYLAFFLIAAIAVEAFTVWQVTTNREIQGASRNFLLLWIAVWAVCCCLVLTVLIRSLVPLAYRPDRIRLTPSTLTFEPGSLDSIPASGTNDGFQIHPGRLFSPARPIVVEAHDLTAVGIEGETNMTPMHLLLTVAGQSDGISTGYGLSGDDLERIRRQLEQWRIAGAPRDTDTDARTGNRGGNRG
jgi:hypothetical protein